MNDRRRVTIEHGSLDLLLHSLREEGFSPIAPTVRDGTIVLGEISGAADLPAGWTDHQEAGKYSLERSGNELFAYAVGPHSWKKYLFPPEQKVFSARRKNHSFEVAEPKAEPARYAFFGVRPCELHAISVLDTVLLGGSVIDPRYRAVREGIFIVAVNCAHPGGTCFCASMETGPRATSGYDIALTEADGVLLAESGTKRGADLLDRMPHRPALESEIAAAEKAIARATKRMGRSVDTRTLPALSASGEHAEWAAAGQRCLTCTNCTMVCPTCFCTTVEDVTDLTGSTAERWRKWDSCFTLEFSYIHGGSVRSSSSSRYRQWLTHKFSSWKEQFGTYGCVGCGRCITWCPVGIDVTEELRVITGGAHTSTQKDKANGHS